MLNSVLAGLALCLGATTSEAQAQEGPPTPMLRLQLDRADQDLLSSEVLLRRIRLRTCAGASIDYDVNAEVDLVEGFSMPVTLLPVCAARFQWGSEFTIWGDGVAGEFALIANPQVTRVNLTTGATHPALRPIRVLDGNPGSHNVPRLFVDIGLFTAGEE